MSKIIIVDENDNPVSSVERAEIETSEIYRVAALWVSNSRDEVLLAQRSLEKKNYPGAWGPAAAGTVEEDETYEVNIYKEAEEEIGLKSCKFTLGPKFAVKGARNYFAQIFTLNLDRNISEFILQKDEVINVKWMPSQELIEDVKTNPDKYTPTVPMLINSLYDTYI